MIMFALVMFALVMLAHTKVVGNGTQFALAVWHTHPDRRVVLPVSNPTSSIYSGKF